MDEYLHLVKSACANKGLTVETLSWETFYKAAGSVSAALLIGKYSLLLQDAVLVPCNTTQSEHWFLLSVLRKEKCATFLDSKAGNFVKTTAHHGPVKMGFLLQEIDSSLDLGQWRFIAKKQDYISQQSNTYDCRIFTYFCARCLVGHSQIIDEDSIPAFMKFMLFDLHENVLHPVPPDSILLEEYNAVEYAKNYYVGVKIP